MPVVTRRRAPLVVAAVTGAALIVPFRMLFPDCGPRRGFLDRPPVKLRVLAPKQSGPLITELATRTFLSTRPEIDGRCIVVHIDKMSSGDAERALAAGWPTPRDRPDVWMPLTRTWVDVLRQDLLRKGAPPLVPDEVADINRTPEVIAMPEPMARALGWNSETGWSGTHIGWKDIYELAQNPDGWKSRGEQFGKWGRFWLARTNPNTSTSGLYSTIAAYYAGKQKHLLRNPLDLTTGDLGDARVIDFVKGVESSVLLYGDTSLSMLPRLYDAALRNRATEFIAAITVAETSVVNYNLGYPTGEAGGEQRSPPSVKLVALYPAEGTLFADQVYVTLNWVQGDKRVAAQKLLRFLQSETAQRRFREHGFRRPNRPAGASAPGDDVLEGAPWIAADAGTVRPLQPPDADVVMAVRDAWATLRKRARLLIVADLSEAASRIENVQSAVERVVSERLHPEDEVGLWTLSPGDPTYAELVPLGPLGPQPNRLQAAGPWPRGTTGTHLYDALQEAIRRFADADGINGIVFLTDGRHKEPGLNTLLGDLAGGRRLGVRVFPIGFGKGVDCGALEDIADTFRTKASCGVTSENFREVFSEVVKSF